MRRCLGDFGSLARQRQHCIRHNRQRRPQFRVAVPDGATVAFINPDTDAIAGSATISESPAYAQQKFTDGETVSHSTMP